MAIHFCPWHLCFSLLLTLSSATLFQRQPGLRLQAGKSWKIGIHSPSKLESDFVLAYFFEVKSCQSCEATELMLYFILGVQEILCFSKPVCQGDVGAIFTPDLVPV